MFVERFDQVNERRIFLEVEDGTSGELQRFRWLIKRSFNFLQLPYDVFVGTGYIIIPADPFMDDGVPQLGILLQLIKMDTDDAVFQLGSLQQFDEVVVFG